MYKDTVKETYANNYNKSIVSSIRNPEMHLKSPVICPLISTPLLSGNITPTLFEIAMYLIKRLHFPTFFAVRLGQWHISRNAVQSVQNGSSYEGTSTSKHVYFLHSLPSTTRNTAVKTKNPLDSEVAFNKEAGDEKNRTVWW